MLKAVEFPAGITNLATSLADVDGDTLTLENKIKKLSFVIFLCYNSLNADTLESWIGEDTTLIL